MVGRSRVSVAMLAATACGEVKQAADAPRGGDGAVTDASGVDAACSFACFGPDLGGLSPRGEASCAGTLACNGPFDWMERIDVCGCSLGSNPATLFVVPDMIQGRAK